MSTATIDNLIAQMSRADSVLSGWDAVLNIDEDLVNTIFQAQFQKAAQDNWNTINIAYRQVFPNPQGDGQIAVYTRVNITLAAPRLKFLGNNQAFVEVSFQATGRTGTAAKVVDAGFDPQKDANPNDPSLKWKDSNFSQTDFTGRVPLSAIAGSPQTGDGVTRFVIDFPSGSFVSPVFESVKDPSQLHLQLKNYLETHAVRYVIASIRTELADQIPQMAPKAFRIAVLTTNENRNIFQIFIATQNAAQPNLTIAVNEPIPDGYSVSVMFNKRIAGQLKTSLMVQSWLFLETNLVFPGKSSLSLGPAFTPGDYLILGTLSVDISPSPHPINPQKDAPMLNIQKTQQITSPGRSSFTAYGDDADPNVWYVPPKAVWAVDSASGLPQLSLIEYKLAGGGVRGFCRFSAQLMVDPADSAALQKAIPGAKLGQFDWISSRAVFTYTIDGKSTSIQAQPSNFGSQVVTFSLRLEDDKAIAAFVNAFSQGSASGTFAVSYELAAQTRLPAVKVVSTFNSSIGYQYQIENRYRVQNQYHTDTWGHRSVEQVSVFVGTFVHEMIQQTQAGTVQVTPGQGLTPALLSMVTNWANVQLQHDVEQAVNTALSLIKNPTSNFSMNSVAGFTHTFETSNVVPWYFQVEGALPPVSKDAWNQLHSVVNEQRLLVTFQVQEDLATHGVSRINLTFQYGSTPSTVHTFEPKSAGPWYINMPGLFDGPKFHAGYQYKYDVVYAAPKRGGSPPPPLSTDWIQSETTVVNFGLVEMGLMAVTFQAANIGWQTTPSANGAPTVKELTVDWNWVPGGNRPVLSESLVLNSQKTSVTSTLRSTAPANNQQYAYSLTFLMSDGTKLHAAGLRGTSPICRIDHPLATMSISVLPMFTAATKAVILRATFDDEKNDIHLSKQWVAKPASPATTVDTDSFNDWDFQAVIANLNMATVVFSGTWVGTDNKQHAIPKTIVVGTNQTLVVSDTQRTVTAVIDASNVPFVPAKTDGVYRVVALVSNSTAPLAQGANPLANAATITFDQTVPAIQYYPTDPIDIVATPTFYYQYIYTVNKDNGAHTDEVQHWKTPQSTVSTALPVIPGSATVLTAVAAGGDAAGLMALARVFGEDPRTRALFARHDEAFAELTTEAAGLLA